ncbi:hypothetical protein Rhopal_003694-T1 [Rhodotorula paludigena]|uniref:DUF4211 domain-containing protein n=1 Tax=Rhodotorula paludigena TaxID=86838 RepID=A0AAV5GNU8_9BASI|nr:hypothetical protein Rhopal_003694-T1 [Rhodotorula paludigena]
MLRKAKLKQSTLRYGTRGAVAAYVDRNKQQDLDGARSDGEDVSADDEQPALEPQEALTLTDSDSDDAGQGQGDGDERGAQSETDSGDELVVMPASSARRRIAPASDSGDNDEQPVASTSPPSLAPTRPTSAAPRSRSRMIFDGVEIPLSPRRAPAPLGARGVSASATPGPGPSTLQRRADAASKAVEVMQVDDGSSEGGDESDEPVPYGSSARKPAAAAPASAGNNKKGKKRALSPSSASSASSNYDDEDDDDDALPIPASVLADNQRRATKRAERLARSSPSASPSAVASGQNKAKKKRTGQRKVATKKRLAALSQGRRDRRSADEGSDAEFVVDDDEEIVWDTPSEEEEAPRVPAKRRKGKGREETTASEQDDAEEEDVDEDEDERRRAKTRRKGKGKAKSATRDEVQRGLLATDSEGDESDRLGLPKQRSKGKRKDTSSSSRKKKHDQDREGKRKRARRARSDDSVDDEPDDLEILDEETVLEDRYRTIKDNSGKFAALRAAREARSNRNKVVLDSDDEAPTSPRKPSQTQRVSPRYLGRTGPSSSNDSGSESSSSGSSNTDDSESSIDKFIIDEEGDEEARRTVDAFRETVRGQSQGLVFYLKTYLLYLVHVIIDPHRDWLEIDPEWKTAHGRVHGHLKGMLGSLIGSSAWKPAFQRAVDRRPEWELQDLDGDEVGAGCDACTMGATRYSVFLAVLSGKKYDRKTLLPIKAEDDSSDDDNSDSDESDEDDDGPAKDAKDKEYTFRLGRHCAGRAGVYHELRHWPYTTKQRLLGKLAPHRRNVAGAKFREGMSKRERQAERDRARQRRVVEAARLVEIMEKQKVMSDFANMLLGEIERATKAFAK